MTTASPGQAQREALEITAWAAKRPVPSQDAVAKLALLSHGGREFDAGNGEMGVGNSCGGDSDELPSLGPLASFGSWQSVAATILHKVGGSADFDQESTIFDIIRWIVFEFQFRTTPFLFNFIDDSRNTFISSLSLWPAISVVTELVENLVTVDTLDGIINSIKKIGQLAVENEGQEEKDSYAQQGVLSVVQGNLRLGLLRTTVQMRYKAGKGYQQLNQQITVSRLFGSLDFGKCIRNSEILLEWDEQDVNKWTSGTSSFRYPPNSSPAWGS